MTVKAPSVSSYIPIKDRQALRAKFAMTKGATSSCKFERHHIAKGGTAGQNKRTKKNPLSRTKSFNDSQQPLTQRSWVRQGTITGEIVRRNGKTPSTGGALQSQNGSGGDKSLQKRSNSRLQLRRQMIERAQTQIQAIQRNARGSDSPSEMHPESNLKDKIDQDSWRLCVLQSIRRWHSADDIRELSLDEQENDSHVFAPDLQGDLLSPAGEVLFDSAEKVEIRKRIRRAKSSKHASEMRKGTMTAKEKAVGKLEKRTGNESLARGKTALSKNDRVDEKSSNVTKGSEIRGECEKNRNETASPSKTKRKLGMDSSSGAYSPMATVSKRGHAPPVASLPSVKQSSPLKKRSDEAEEEESRHILEWPTFEQKFEGVLRATKIALREGGYYEEKSDVREDEGKIVSLT